MAAVAPQTRVVLEVEEHDRVVRPSGTARSPPGRPWVRAGSSRADVRGVASTSSGLARRPSGSAGQDPHVGHDERAAGDGRARWSSSPTISWRLGPGGRSPRGPRAAPSRPGVLRRAGPPTGERDLALVRHAGAGATGQHHPGGVVLLRRPLRAPPRRASPWASRSCGEGTGGSSDAKAPRTSSARARRAGPAARPRARPGGARTGGSGPAASCGGWPGRRASPTLVIGHSIHRSSLRADAGRRLNPDGRARARGGGSRGVATAGPRGTGRASGSDPRPCSGGVATNVRVPIDRIGHGNRTRAELYTPGS